MSIFVINLFTLSLINTFSIKHSSFHVYEVSGVMYNYQTKEILSNELFIINSDTVYTNNKGEYRYKVLYIAGKSKGNLSIFQARRMYNLINPKYIVYKYNSETIFVKNKWRKFIGKPNKIYHKNLKW